MCSKDIFLRVLLTVRPHGIVILIQAVPYGSASSKLDERNIEKEGIVFNNCWRIVLSHFSATVVAFDYLFISLQPRNQTTIKHLCSCIPLKCSVEIGLHLLSAIFPSFGRSHFGILRQKHYRFHDEYICLFIVVKAFLRAVQ